MPDLIIRDSDGRVQTSAKSIVTVGDRYVATNDAGIEAEYPVNSFGVDTHIVTAAPATPLDMVEGFNYNYIDGTYVDSGVSPPPPPPPPEEDEEDDTQP